MSSKQLLASLESAGLTVVEHDGWETNGYSWSGGKPTGIMQHHTAPPNPYPMDRLDANGQLKANIGTLENGEVHLLAYHACNYSSGTGMSSVLEKVRNCEPPTANGNQSGDMGGNSYFWNYENSHPGDGSPIPAVQLEAIIMSAAIVASHFGLEWCQTISHAEWTSRKIDPKWNGSNRTAIEEIREGMQMALGPNGEPNWQDVSDFAKNSWTWAWTRDGRITSDSSAPKDTITKEELMVHLKRFAQE